MVPGQGHGPYWPRLNLRATQRREASDLSQVVQVVICICKFSIHGFRELSSRYYALLYKGLELLDFGFCRGAGELILMDDCAPHNN